jgi:DNA-binding response OmpR family regulator
MGLETKKKRDIFRLKSVNYFLCVTVDMVPWASYRAVTFESTFVMPKILLVDDDVSVRGFVRIALTEMGHQVTEAGNGNEGLRSFERSPTDMVITDLVMPEQEGLETLAIYRKMHPGVKIIAMSGGGRGNASDYLKMAKIMGADLVLAKPFSIDELKTTVDALC